MLPKTLLLHLTTASNSVLRAAFGYKVKDISTVSLHLRAGLLTPYQRSFMDKAMVFWIVINNCEPENLLLELLNQGAHHEGNKTFTFNKTTMQMVIRK
jgi:hypothetical protein